jgi:hypothetical protein
MKLGIFNVTRLYTSGLLNSIPIESAKYKLDAVGSTGDYIKKE